MLTMASFLRASILCATLIFATNNIHTLSSPAFKITIGQDSGSVLSITNPNDKNSSMSWSSNPDNAPWLPTSSQWGLGYADTGPLQLHRGLWRNPQNSRRSDGVYRSTYDIGPLGVVVDRNVDRKTKGFTEKYTFTNIGSAALALSSTRFKTEFAIFTPFNDHYTNASDVLEHRAHAHIWAFGGGSSWVKLTRMGGRGPHLGLVVTQGGLQGYSLDSRNTFTGSNTRGVVLLHPAAPVLQPGDSYTLSWTMFWHDDWNDFFQQCETRSKQFIRLDASTMTVYTNEPVKVNVSGSSVGLGTTVNGLPVSASSGSTYTVTIPSLGAGQQTLNVSTASGAKTTIILNSIPNYNETIQKRVEFIAANQQIPESNGSAQVGAYVVYDNQVNALVTFDTASDRNPGRERLGMGVLISRWLKNHPNPASGVLLDSLQRFYNYANTVLQGPDGWVFNGPPNNAFKRLYNWPWMMQLHLGVAELNITSPSGKSALDLFLLTVENFYQNNATFFYPIGVPVLDGLHALKASGDTDGLNRTLTLFKSHGQKMLEVGVNYPTSEVNFEQSIVAPAATFLLELYRFTNESKWLTGAKLHLDVLENFGGQQPDFRLRDIAIRHWDGYWFGKDRMWGDTFPHYWSTLTAVAFHHYAKATGDKSYEKRAEGILRTNLSLFFGDGKASCAYIYPSGVNGRPGRYADGYANDQDWALVHLLQIKEEYNP